MGGCSTHLQEDLAVDAIRLILEDRREDDGDAVVAGLDVDGLLFAVVDGHDLATLAHALRRLLRHVLGRLLLQLVVLLVGQLEGRRHGVALEQRQLQDQGISRF